MCGKGSSPSRLEIVSQRRGSGETLFSRRAPGASLKLQTKAL